MDWFSTRGLNGILADTFFWQNPPKNIVFSPARHLLLIASVETPFLQSRKRCLACRGFRRFQTPFAPRSEPSWFMVKYSTLLLFKALKKNLALASYKIVIIEFFYCLLYFINVTTAPHFIIIFVFFFSLNRNRKRFFQSS